MTAASPSSPRPRITWPAGLGPNTPANRARVIARAAWHALRSCGDQGAQLAADIAASAALFGDDVWLSPPPTGAAPGDRLTRHQVAIIAEVSDDAVRLWGIRGLSRAGERRHLHPDPVTGDYSPDQAAEFLRWRDATERQETPTP